MSTEMLVYLVNDKGDQAKVPMLRVDTDNKQQAIRIANSHGFKNYNVVEECDSSEGVSRQRVATVRNGQSSI